MRCRPRHPCLRRRVTGHPYTGPRPRGSNCVLLVLFCYELVAGGVKTHIGEQRPGTVMGCLGRDLPRYGVKVVHAGVGSTRSKSNDRAVTLHRWFLIVKVLHLFSTPSMKGAPSPFPTPNTHDTRLRGRHREPEVDTVLGRRRDGMSRYWTSRRRAGVTATTPSTSGPSSSWNTGRTSTTPRRMSHPQARGSYVRRSSTNTVG